MKILLSIVFFFVTSYLMADELTPRSFDVTSKSAPPARIVPTYNPEHADNVEAIIKLKKEVVDLQTQNREIKALLEKIVSRPVPPPSPVVKVGSYYNPSPASSPYDEMKAQAIKQGRVLVIWVKYNSPLAQARLKNYIHCHVESFPNVNGSGVIVQVPDGRGGLTRHDFAGIPAPEDIEGRVKKCPLPPIIRESTTTPVPPGTPVTSYYQSDTPRKVEQPKRVDDDSEYYDNTRGIYWRYNNETSKRKCQTEMNTTGKQWYLSSDRMYYWRLDVSSQSQPSYYYFQPQPSSYYYPTSTGGYYGGSCVGGG